MSHFPRHPRRSLASLAIGLLVGLALCLGRTATDSCQASEPQSPRTGPTTAADQRLNRLESRLRQIESENRRLAEELHSLRHAATPALRPVAADESELTPAWPERLSAEEAGSVLAEPLWPESPTEMDGRQPATVCRAEPQDQPWIAGSDPPLFASDSWQAGYDRGFALAPAPGNDSPFSLRVNNQTMFRYAGFLREEETWTNSAGVRESIDSFSNFQIPRGRLSFSGGALLPALSYQVILDYNTVSNDPIGFRAYLLSYALSEALVVHVGQNKVPGSREWLTSAFQVQGPDRSLATTFFRPSLSQGIWITGSGFDQVHYHLMLANGFNTSNLPARELNVYPCWSGSVWWEPLGSFGKDSSDLQWHEDLAVRVGTSQTFAQDRGSQSSSGTPENSLLRLTDGTVITDAGAIAPGVTLTDYTVLLSAFDVGVKYRGLSLLGELYFQRLGRLQGTGSLPVSSLEAVGGYLQGGVFVLPKEVELYGRGSVVSGDQGTGGESAGGFNWFPLAGRDNLRVTTDLAYILRSSAEQNRTNYFAGYTGWLLRAQVSTSF